jgi:hypothetical protein
MESVGLSWTQLEHHWDIIGTSLGHHWDIIGTSLGHHWNKLDSDMEQTLRGVRRKGKEFDRWQQIFRWTDPRLR